MKISNFILLSISLLFFFSCDDENIVESKENITYTLVDDPETIVNNSGLKGLRMKHRTEQNSVTWNDFHNNYLETSEKYKNHKKWNTYSSSLIFYIVLHTEMLDNIDEKNYSILENYLEELKSLQTAYPKIHYLILEKLNNYVGKKELAKAARLSYDKANKQKDKVEFDLKLMPDSSVVEKIAKDGAKVSYEENYIIYLSKLKEFFIQSE